MRVRLLVFRVVASVPGAVEQVLESAGRVRGLDCFVARLSGSESAVVTEAGEAASLFVALGRAFGEGTVAALEVRPAAPGQLAALVRAADPEEAIAFFLYGLGLEGRVCVARTAAEGRWSVLRPATGEEAKLWRGYPSQGPGGQTLIVPGRDVPPDQLSFEEFQL